MGYNYYNNTRNFDQRTCTVSDKHDMDMPGKSLAMAYVPWQNWRNIYDIDKGFCIGTIFAELNKPFEGGRKS